MSSSIPQIIVGVALFLVGVVLAFLEMVTPPTHTWHLAIFVGLILFGAIVTVPKLLTPLQGLANVVGPFVPGYAQRAAIKAAQDVAASAATTADKAQDAADKLKSALTNQPPDK